MEIIVETQNKRQVIDITKLIEEQLSGDGLVNVFVKHTTAAVAIADLDPGTDKDLLEAIDSMTPEVQWRHPHNPAHFPDHLWSTLLSTSLLLPFKNAKLNLGSWQRLILIELDGPRGRQLEITTLSVS
jgi:secondary thiamine-phosphate synthase enzyme